MIARIRRSAAEGALAWLAYAVVETAFTVLVPWLAKPAYEYRQYHWGFTALLFILYPAIGALLGAAAALVLRGRLASHGGTLALIALFAADVLFDSDLGAWMPVLLAMAVVLAGLIVISALAPTWPARLAFVRSPWFVAVFVAGIPCILTDLLLPFTRTARIGWTLAYVAAVGLLALVFSRRPQAGLWRRALVTAGVAAVTLVLCLLPKAQPRITAVDAARPAPGPGQPNVILVTLDTVRADHLSVYGYTRATTPNLERFSTEAVLYKQAIAPADMTLPSHGSLFTGVYASRHGAHMSREYPHGRPLESKFPTLAEILRAKGYATSAVVANSGYLQQVFLFHRGFDYYDDRWPVSFLIDTQPAWLRGDVVTFLRRVLPVGEAGRVYRDAHTVTDEALRLLETARTGGRPLFLFVNYMDAHFPCSPPAPFNTMFPGRNAAYTSTRYAAMKQEVMSLKRPIRGDERDHLISQYDGGVAYVDSELARLFDRLRQLGIYENSLIVVTADHGEAFGERHLMEHGGVSVYQDEVRVPLIVKYPHSASRGSLDQRVSLVDVMPTVLQTAGYSAPAGIDGRSLGESATGRVILSECFTAPELIKWHARFDRDERAIYSGPLKLIASTKGARELYDIERDPVEARNLYASHPGAAKPLEAGLRQWVAAVVRPAPQGAAPQLRLDALKSLGYVQ